MLLVKCMRGTPGKTAGAPLRMRIANQISLVVVPELHAECENGGGLRRYELDRVRLLVHGSPTADQIKAAIGKLIADLSKRTFPWQQGTQRGTFFFENHVLLDLSEFPEALRAAAKNAVLDSRGGLDPEKRDWEVIAFREGQAAEFVVAYASSGIQRWSEMGRVYSRKLNPGCVLSPLGVPLRDSTGQPFFGEAQSQLNVADCDVQWMDPSSTPHPETEA